MKIKRYKPVTFRPPLELVDLLDKEISKKSNPRNRSEEIILRLMQSFKKEK